MLLLDGAGTILDIHSGAALADESDWQQILGRSWSEIATSDSRQRAEELLRQALADGTAGPVELTQRLGGLEEVALRYVLVGLDDGRWAALGRDLTPIVELKRRSTSAEQALTRMRRRLREEPSPYRELFRVSEHGVLVVDGAGRTIIEANPAAAALLGRAVDHLRDQRLGEVFSGEARDEVMTLVGVLEAGAQRFVTLPPTASMPELTATGSVFGRPGGPSLLLRFWPKQPEQLPSPRSYRMARAIDAVPEGFVVTDEQLLCLHASPGFCGLVQRPTEAQVVGARLDRWLGRPGVDTNIIVTHLRESGVVQDFSTIVRGELGPDQEALVTGASFGDAERRYAFLIRPVATQPIVEIEDATFLPRSVDELRALVGRVSLRDVVKESSDLIERICIEAALETSNDNRAAAAQLLGLSRQSLYAKLRRHGMS